MSWGRYRGAGGCTYAQHDPIREQGLERDGHGEVRVELVRNAVSGCVVAVVVKVVMHAHGGNKSLPRR